MGCKKSPSKFLIATSALLALGLSACHPSGDGNKNAGTPGVPGQVTPSNTVVPVSCPIPVGNYSCRLSATGDNGHGSRNDRNSRDNSPLAIQVSQDESGFFLFKIHDFTYVADAQAHTNQDKKNNPFQYVLTCDQTTVNVDIKATQGIAHGVHYTLTPKWNSSLFNVDLKSYRGRDTQNETGLCRKLRD